MSTCQCQKVQAQKWLCNSCPVVLTITSFVGVSSKEFVAHATHNCSAIAKVYIFMLGCLDCLL